MRGFKKFQEGQKARIPFVNLSPVTSPKFRLKYACHPSSSSHHALSQSDAGSELADVHPRSNETSVSRPLARPAYLNRGRRESVPSHSLSLSLSRHRHLHSSRGAIVKREMIHSTERPGAVAAADQVREQDQQRHRSVCRSVQLSPRRPVQFYVVNPNGTNGGRSLSLGRTLGALSVCRRS